MTDNMGVQPIFVIFRHQMRSGTSFTRFSSQFLAIWTVFLLSVFGTGVRLSHAQLSGEQRVIIVSVDGLTSDILQNLGASRLPSFFRFIDEGASTYNARNDPDYTITLPNHASILTGRFVDGSQGHQWSNNSDPSPGETVHTNAGVYIPGIFDVAHDAGGRTGLFATKTKFSLFDQSWDALGGAPDISDVDNGTDKIDEYVYSTSSAGVVQAFINASAQPFDLAFLHFFEPDDVGHLSTWDPHPLSPYAEAVQAVDQVLATLLDFVRQNAAYAGRTTIILTADHGGTGNNHIQQDLPINFTIPFMAWGNRAGPGANLYELNSASRVDPGAGYTLKSSADIPIRNADAPNLALHLLGLPPIPGSTINASQDFVIGDGGDAVAMKAIAFQDGVFPTATYAGTRDTKIKSDAPGTNFGSDADLEMDADPDYSTLIKWDLSLLPVGSRVLMATMVFDITNITNLNYEYYGLTTNWDEDFATWTSATALAPWSIPGAIGPSDHSPTSLGTITASAPAVYRIDIPEAGLPLVQGWIDDPSTNHGLIFQDYTSGDDGLDFSSSEHPEPSRRPRLEITYSDTPPPLSPDRPVAVMNLNLRRDGGSIHMEADAQASFDPDGHIALYEWAILASDTEVTTSSGSSLSYEYSSLGAYEIKLSVTDDAGNTASTSRAVIVDAHDGNKADFHDGIAPISAYRGTRDTKLLSSSQSTSFGNVPWLEVDGSPLDATLLSWDLSAIAPGIDVTKATIRFEVLDESADTYEVYAMNRVWTEEQSNWLYTSEGQFWEAEGAAGSSDRSETVLAELNGAAIGVLEVPLNAEGLGLISKWINHPETNNGLILQDYLAASDGLDLASREFGTADMRPRLSLEYQTRHHATLPERLVVATYPNPFANHLTINLGSDIPHDVRFELYDMLGRRVLVQSLPSGLLSGPIRLDTSDLATGMYALRIVEHSDIVSKTVLVAKTNR